ncbi:MAG TPA: tetratricopeptide repeat protein [Xanthomonadaceae bacterium]|nr:tetratricopeptide repeat protein [Xanthomonadaceae bacterium]
MDQVEAMDLLAELKRRNVIRMAGLYLVGAWLVVQVADTLFPAFGMPAWALRSVVVLLAIGFVPALTFAWIFELTPEGIRPDADVDQGGSGARRTARRMNRILVGALVLALAWFGIDRFVLVPGDVEAAPSARERPATADAPAGDKSIAVLPFVDMSQAGDQAYFSDGLSEELLNQLAQVPQLRVIARTSSFSFKDRNVDIATIAGALGVAHVLEGSVRKSGNRLRVTAQLIRASDSTHLWSQTYDRALADVFALQDEISREIVSALKVELLPEQRLGGTQRTSNPAAYEAYLRGMDANRSAGQGAAERALAAFEQAVELDPVYANAHAALALARNVAADYAASPAQRTEQLDQAFAAAGQAIALAPDLAAGYTARGTLRNLIDWDWAGAATDLERALALDPNDPATLTAYAHLMFFGGRHGEAIAMLRRATDIDPLAATTWFNLGVTLSHDGQADAAREALQRASDLSVDANWPEFYLGFLDLQAGDTEGALLHFLRAPDPYRLAGTAMLEHTRGNPDASQAALEALQERYAVGFAYQIAQVHAWRGEADLAFAWLQRGYDSRDYGLTRLRDDPILRALADDPRFAVLVDQVGFGE